MAVESLRPGKGATSANVERVLPDPAVNPLAFLLSPHDVPHAPRAGGATLNLYVAGGRDAEVEEACRRIFAAGVSLDQVEVVCAAAST